MMAGRMLKIHQREQLKHKCRLLIATAFTVPLLIITMVLPEYPKSNAWLDTSLMRGLNLYGVLLLVLSSPVQWLVGWSFHAKGISSMISGSLGMDFLISSGTTAAYMFSVFGLIQGIFSLLIKIQRNFYLRLVLLNLLLEPHINISDSYPK